MRTQSLERIFSVENMGNLFKLGRTPSEDEFQKFLTDNGLDQQEGAEELRDLPRVASIDLLRAYFSDNLSPQQQQQQQQTQKQQQSQQPPQQQQPLQQPPQQPAQQSHRQPEPDGPKSIPASTAPAPSPSTIKAEPSATKAAAEPCPIWKEQKVNVKKADEPKAQPSGTANPTPPPSSCGSDDDEEDLELKALKLKETDPDKQMNKEELRRLRRMISNRESARRSRRRKLEHVNCLDNQIAQLKNENTALLERLAGMEQRCRDAMMDNSMLREEVDALQLQLRSASGGKMHRSSSLQRIASQEHLAKRGRAVPGDFSAGHHYFQNPSPPCRQQFDPNMGMMFRSMNSFENMMQLQYPGGAPVPGN